MEKVLLTGSSGFIGSYLYKRLTNDGYHVLGIDKKKPLEKSQKNFILLDILDKERLENEIKKFLPDIVLHLAARTDLGEGDSLEGFVDNTKGTENMVDVCNKVSSIKKFLFTSTILVLPVRDNPKSSSDYNPESPYGESKMLGEVYIRKNLVIAPIIVRPTSIWGPSYGSHYEHFFTKIYQNKFFNINGYNPKITFGYLGNFYYQVMQLLSKDIPNSEVFYLGDYNPIFVRKWADLIRKGFGSKKIKSLPYFALKTVALLGDLLLGMFNFKRFPLNSYRLSNLTNDRLYDLSSTKKVAPKLPVSLEQAVEETVEWYKTNKLINKY